MRRALIDDRHMFLVAILERYFRFDVQTICDWLLDNQQLEAMQEFFEKGKSNVLFVISADHGFNTMKSSESLENYRIVYSKFDLIH